MAFTDFIGAAAVQTENVNTGNVGDILLTPNGGGDLVGAAILSGGTEVAVRGYIRYAIERDPTDLPASTNDLVKDEFARLAEIRFAYKGTVNSANQLSITEWSGIPDGKPVPEILKRQWRPTDTLNNTLDSDNPPLTNNANKDEIFLQLIATNEPTAKDFLLFEGDVGFNLEPTTDATYDLGSAPNANLRGHKRFRNGHFSSDVVAARFKASETITAAGIVIPIAENGVADAKFGLVGDDNANILIPKVAAGIDAPIAAEPTDEQKADNTFTDPNSKRLISAKLLRDAITAIETSINGRVLARNENAAPAVPGADNIWPTPGAFLGQRWIHGNDEYVWLRTGGENDDAEANKFPAVRWAQTKGAVRIFRAGTSTAGELDDISVASSHFYVKSANADREWNWTDFAEICIGFIQSGVPAEVAQMPSAAWIAGLPAGMVEEGYQRGLARYTGESTFSNSAGNSTATQIWGVF